MLISVGDVFCKFVNKFRRYTHIRDVFGNLTHLDLTNIKSLSG